MDEQKIYLYKVNMNKVIAFKNQLDKTNSGESKRVGLILRMLAGEMIDEHDSTSTKATVILLSNDKEILRREEMVQQLEDIDDQA